MERECLAYCDRCGQTLSWASFSRAKVINWGFLLYGRVCLLCVFWWLGVWNVRKWKARPIPLRYRLGFYIPISALFSALNQFESGSIIFLPYPLERLTARIFANFNTYCYSKSALLAFWGVTRTFHHDSLKTLLVVAGAFLAQRVVLSPADRAYEHICMDS